MLQKWHCDFRVDLKRPCSLCLHPLGRHPPHFKKLMLDYQIRYHMKRARSHAGESVTTAQPPRRHEIDDWGHLECSRTTWVSSADMICSRDEPSSLNLAQIQNLEFIAFFKFPKFCGSLSYKNITKTTTIPAGLLWKESCTLYSTIVFCVSVTWVEPTFWLYSNLTKSLQ